MSGLNRASAGCFDAYDSLGRRLLRTYSVNARWARWASSGPACCRPFEVVVWMTDGWPLYESRLKENCIISKRYAQRIERHNLNLRQHLARLGRKSLSFSKSVELHGQSHQALSEHKTLSISWSHYSQLSTRVLGHAGNHFYWGKGICELTQIICGDVK